MGGGGGSKKQTISYKYYMGMHMGLCLGPINSVNKIYVGERLAWLGPATYVGLSSIFNEYIDNPTLFGGEKKEGGVLGPFDIMFGADDQGQNSYLLGQLGDIPAFRGFVSVVLNQCYISAGSPYPKSWWFEVTRIPGNDQVDIWYPEKSEPRSGSANAAHIVRECLVNKKWGMGYSELSIDEDSFIEVADTLYDENFGLSYILSSQGTTEEFVQEVLKTVNGVLHTDRTTGKFVLKLVRDDYLVEELLVLGEDNILEYTSFQRPQPGELVNEITIVYKRQQDFNDTSVTFQDLASVTSQGAVISQTLQFSGVDSDEIANIIGMRELRQYSTPLSQVVFTANRQAWDLNPGDAFIFSWAERGISQLIMRATKINYGELTDGKIVITAIEDIFGLPEATYVQPQDNLWDDPIGEPTALSSINVTKIEAPYFLLATNFESSTLNSFTEDASLLIVVASFPTFASPSFELWTTTVISPSTSDYKLTITGTYCYKILLGQDITKTDNEIDISVSGFPGIFEEDVEVGSLCLIGDEGDSSNAELAVINSYDTGTSVINLKRGALDTLPKDHATNTAIWFINDNWAFDDNEYSDGGVVTFRTLPVTGISTLNIEDASAESITMEGRQYRPSPPSYITLFDEGPVTTGERFFPPTISGALRVSWRRTNRITQTVEGEAPYFYNTDDITAEDNTVWRIALYAEDDLINPVVTIDNPATTTQYLWSSEEADSGLTGRLNNVFRVRFISVRQETVEIESKEAFDITVERRGWTYQWNKYWNGVE